MKLHRFRSGFPLVLAGLLALVAVACGAAATATPAPTTVPRPTQAPQVGPTATPTAAPTATPLPAGIVSARDEITLVIPEEPINLNSHRSIGASLNAPVSRDNLVDPLTWQSGDDQRVVPTSASTGWEQLAPDKWRFTLRQGVKFHNGERWDAQAALPNTQYLGFGANDNTSFPYTGGYTAAATDDYTLDITCDQPCPILPNTAFFLSFEAPNYLQTTPEDELVRGAVGFGPYKLVRWRPGVDITEEAYADYVPAETISSFRIP